MCRGRGKIAQVHRFRLACVSRAKGRLQARPIRTGIPSRGVGRYLASCRGEGRSSGWLHGLDSASRIHRVQVTILRFLDREAYTNLNRIKCKIAWVESGLLIDHDHDGSKYDYLKESKLAWKGSLLSPSISIFWISFLKFDTWTVLCIYPCFLFKV